MVFNIAYEAAFQYSEKSFLSLFFPLILFFTDRLLGHAPINFKDPVFAVYYIFGSLVIVVSSKVKSNYLRLIFLGLCFGLAALMRGECLDTACCCRGHDTFGISASDVVKIKKKFFKEFNKFLFIWRNYYLI